MSDNRTLSPELQKIEDGILDKWNELLELNTQMIQSPKVRDVPFEFDVKVFKVKGQVHFRDPIKDTTVDGKVYVTGSKIASFNLTWKDYDVTVSFGLFKITIEIDRANGCIQWRVCTKKFPSGWDCHGWNSIMCP